MFHFSLLRREKLPQETAAAPALFLSRSRRKFPISRLCSSSVKNSFLGNSNFEPHAFEEWVHLSQSDSTSQTIKEINSSHTNACSYVQFSLRLCRADPVVTASEFLLVLRQDTCGFPCVKKFFTENAVTFEPMRDWRSPEKNIMIAEMYQRTWTILTLFEELEPDFNDEQVTGEFDGKWTT